MQTSEAQRRTNNLQQNSRKKKHYIENEDLQVELNEKVENLNFNEKLHYSQ